MARSSRSGNRRQWVWARSAAFLVGSPVGNTAYGATDLLEGARTDWGNGVLRGATVVTVKGWIRPNVANGVRVDGRAGIRVAPRTDIAETGTNPDETPAGVGGYEDWMGFFQYDVAAPADAGIDVSPATFNAANDWHIEVNSSRKMTDLSHTLGLFYYHSNVYSAEGSAVQALDYDLSIGLKLP